MLNALPIADIKTNESELRKNQKSLVPNYFGHIVPGVVKMLHFPERKKRTRLVVKIEAENIFLLLENIVFFYTENKIVFAIDQEGKKYVANESLSLLESELDNNIFFRANRQYIININHIKSFRAYERVKLRVDMNPVELNDRHFIIVSQETAPAFKKWIYTA